jgi:hypothetical protein
MPSYYPPLLSPGLPVSLQCSHCSQHDMMQGHQQSQETKMMMTMTTGRLNREDKDQVAWEAMTQRE